MQSTGNPPALAEAADLLSDQLRAHVGRLTELLRPHEGAVERRLSRRLRELNFNAKQRKALAGITPGAAAALPPGKGLLTDFFEQVEYNGRRLAKLNLAPSRILEALREYDQSLGSVFRRLPAAEHANLRWTLEQLHFCVVLTLNNAFYQVREAETLTYQQLFHAELESQNLNEMLLRMLEILSHFCQAEAGVLALVDARRSRWVLRGATLRGDRTELSVQEIPDTPGRFKWLSKPRCHATAELPEQLVLDLRWRDHYRSCWSVPLKLGSQIAGVMQFGFPTHYEWLPRELELLSAAGDRCILAAEKARLAGELAEREKQVRRLAAYMMQIEERERKRISSELHDEAGQSLLCARLQLEMMEKTTPGISDELKAGLVETRLLTERTIVEIRRLIADLSPAILEKLGLAAAVRQLASRLRRLHNIRVKLRMAVPADLSQSLARVTYRLVQECINNIARHSFASRVNISIHSTDERLRLCVDDDGVGFKVEEVLDKRESFGLSGMRERVTLFGGTFRIESQPRRGTKILIELPIPQGDSTSVLSR